MKILVSGSSGLVGTAVVESLIRRGDHVFRLLRVPAFQSRSTDIIWNPATGDIALSHLEGLDAVIHLAGEGIATGRWTNEKKKKIHQSRTEPTHHLSRLLSQINRPPKVFITASAIGIYGDRKNEILDEKSAPGSGFLSTVVKSWEEATVPARDKGIRVVNLRFGIILSARGGALAQMLLPFRLGVGGRLGRGDQYMSWIDIGDVVDVVQYILKQEKIQGPVNVVSPGPVTNREFTKTLGWVLNRPTVLPVPSFALKWALGEMAEELLLSSTRVTPDVLLSSGFRFRFPDLLSSLQHLLARQ